MKKKITALVLALAMTVGMAQGAFAVDIEDNPVENFIVSPVDYQAVATKVAEAQEETEIKTGEGVVHYYWGLNSAVVQDNSGYYFIEFNEDFTQFFVNGKPFDITTKSGVTPYAYSWNTMYDFEKSFDVGGLPASVVGGIIGGAIGGIFSGGTATVVSLVTGAVAGMLIGGVFPIDYKLTVDFFKKVRVLELGEPNLLEFYEELGVYGGPSDDLYETELYYDTKTYTQEVYDSYD